MDGRRLPTGNVTFLFTDIEGSTRIVRDIGAARYGELLEQHRTALRGVFGERDGIEVGTEGDSFFVVFERPGAALAAAAEAQRRLAAIDWPEDARIRVRIGVHTGDGTLSGGSDATYVGSDVNRAARIMAAGHGGQVIVSASTAGLVEGGLPADLRLRDLGRHRLKDLLPERLWQLDGDGLASTFPPLRSLDARPNNLPTQLTSFVGRDEELAEARAAAAEARLLTLTGPGGTGKTRLSLQLAANLAEEFPDGTFFVALEPVRDPAVVAPRIAATVGIVESPTRTALDLLGEWLAEKRVLLVLDNFEQVVDAAPVVAQLLRQAEHLRVIATSRAPLHVSGEQEFPVQGLPVPPDPQMSALERARLSGAARTLDVESAMAYPAIRLFVARAAAVRPDFRLTSANVAAVATICARLRGLPLAIELAAARVKLLSPDAILGRLSAQLDVLAGGARDLPARQQTLRGAIAWSYDLLDDGLRRLLERLSVFRGGAALAEIEPVAGPAAEVGGDVLDGVGALVDHSLVRVDEAAPADQLRYVMLEPIREFAFEHLAERGDAAELRRRHATAFAGLAERAAAELTGPDQRAWLDRLDREHDNLRAALDRAGEAGDLRMAARIAFALWRFWQQRGHVREARRRLADLLGADWPSGDAGCRRQLLEAAGGIAYWSSEFVDAGRYYTEAVALARTLGDPSELANALYNYAFAAFRSVRSPETRDDDRLASIGALEEALAIYRSLGDEHGAAKVLWGIGTAEYYFERLDLAEPPLRDALAILASTDDRTMEAWARHMLALVGIRSGRLDGAGELLSAALEHFHAAGDLGGVTLGIGDFSGLALANGDVECAVTLRAAARALESVSGVELGTFSTEQLTSGIRHRLEALPPERIALLEAEGAALSLDDAVALALGHATPHSPKSHDEPAAVG